MKVHHKAVIFDMDGVIVDSEPLHIRLEAQLCRELGASVSKAEAASFLGTNSYDMWRGIRERHGITLSVEELVQRERDRYAEIVRTEGVPLVPGIVEVITAVADAGFLLAVASSAPMEQIDHALELTGVPELFRVRVSGDMVTHSKPDPAIFTLTARKLDVAPRDCVVVEDSPNGVTAARAAGMTSIGFANPASGSPDLSGADLVCRTIEEVRRAILNGQAG